MSSGNRLTFVIRGMAVAALGGVLALSTPALAQGGGGRGPGGGGGFGGGGFGAIENSTISKRDMDKYAGMLGLTKDQKEIVDVLVQGYSEQVRQMSEQMRAVTEKAREEFRETQDASVWEEVGEQMQGMRDRRQKIEKSLLDDVQAVLIDDQANLWPKVDRAIRRDRGLRFGFISGERVDLFALSEQAKLDDGVRGSVVEILDRYELELDSALVERQRLFEEGMGQARELMRSGDMEKAEELMSKGREASMRVRDINRRFARQVMDVLPDGVRGEWDMMVKRASYPEIYRDSLTSRSVQAALGMSDLSAEQKDSISLLSDSYNRSVSTVNDKLAKERDTADESFTIRDMMRQGFGGGRDGDSGLRTEKRDLDNSTLEKLKQILTPAQIEKLPKPEDRGQRGQDGEGQNRFQGGQRGGRGGQV